MIIYFTFPGFISPTTVGFSELFTFCFVCFVHERGQDVTVFYVEVVVGSEHISGDDCCVLTAMLLEVRPVDTNTHVIPM